MSVDRNAVHPGLEVHLRQAGFSSCRRFLVVGEPSLNEMVTGRIGARIMEIDEENRPTGAVATIYLDSLTRWHDRSSHE